MDAFLHFAADNLPDLWSATGRHIFLTGTATFIATLAGIPLGIACYSLRPLRGPVLGIASIMQTIPSLAMLGILLSLTGQIGVVPAVTALMLYAILPITRNTTTGLDGVPAGAKEAARAMGMTPPQLLTRVELPLALPVIIAGIRTAAVIGVGIATLSTYIGAGGLGDFIKSGLAMRNNYYILLGTIPAALLALLVDFAIWSIERGITHLPSAKRTALNLLMKRASIVPFALLVFLGIASATVPLTEEERVAAGEAAAGRIGDPGTIRIGSKVYPEQVLLAEITSQLVENRTKLTVERLLGLGGTIVCHEAMVQDELDLYIEYTGTGYAAVLNRDKIIEPRYGTSIGAYDAYAAVKKGYREKFGLVWLEPFGFENTYVMTVRRDAAAQRGWKKVSDLADNAKNLVAGVTSEFHNRQDGYPGLADRYGMRFGAVKDLEFAMMYEALRQGQVDVISGFSTNWQLEKYDLVPLRDDRRFFPPYDAAPVVRRAFLDKHPEVRKVLSLLAGSIDNETMRRLNLNMKETGSEKAVAETFLRSRDLLITGKEH